MQDRTFFVLIADVVEPEEGENATVPAGITNEAENDIRFPECAFCEKAAHITLIVKDVGSLNVCDTEAHYDKIREHFQDAPDECWRPMGKKLIAALGLNA